MLALASWIKTLHLSSAWLVSLLWAGVTRGDRAIHYPLPSPSVRAKSLVPLSAMLSTIVYSFFWTFLSSFPLFPEGLSLNVLNIYRLHCIKCTQRPVTLNSEALNYRKQTQLYLCKWKFNSLKFTAAHTSYKCFCSTVYVTDTTLWTQHSGNMSLLGVTWTKLSRTVSLLWKLG